MYVVTRGISLLSVIGKPCRRLQLKVRAGTACAIREEASGFRHRSGCMDQVFAVRQVCEKYLTNRTDVFWAFLDSEK